MPESQDSFQIRTEYMTTLQKKTEVTQTLLEGAGRVIAAGEEGIKEIANAYPEVLLAAIAGLSAVIEEQNTEHLKLAEDWFTALDDLQDLVGKYEALARCVYGP